MSNPNIDRAFRAKNGISFGDQVYLIYLEFDPSITPGFEAPIGSIALTTGDLYQKIGSNDTDWRKFQFSSSSTISYSYYFGAEDINGTWRIIKNDNDLLVQRRESDIYNTKATFEGITGGTDSGQGDSESGEYFGDALVNGTWRICLRSGDLSFQRKEQSSWFYKYELDTTPQSSVTDAQDDNTAGLYIIQTGVDNNFRFVKSGNNLNIEQRESGTWRVYLEIEP